MKKTTIPNGDTNGRVTLPDTREKGRRIAMEKPQQRRAVTALYPLEKTSMAKNVLDKAIAGAMGMRPDYKRD